ncbi:UNVERIFIED_CONTAM: hypothetical protein Slati_4533800 [Sesamum latifolium]|uniref:RNase H type-1 domain-containing protein n=1 Tax=Sesamum latifolium TaxID=2727402 RepID=A0AAW2SGB3_9LAMI
MEDTPIIQFGRAEHSGPRNSHNDALVIMTLLANYEVGRIFIDSRSSADILFADAYDQMQLGDIPLEKEPQQGVSKDFYPLPRIDQLVDSTSGCELLSMTDASQGRHASQEERGKNHVADLEETLSVLRKYKLKLNPGKYAFGIQGGRFLDFMVTKRGIEANPLKNKAIVDMKAPANIKEVQQLTGRIAALSSFISKAEEKSLPFFKVLRKAKNFEWDAFCQQAFEELKIYLAGLPLLVKLCQWDTLYLYLSATPQAVSYVLIHGSSTIQGSGAGIVITSPQGEELEFAVKFGFKASNNEVEYKALMTGMKMDHEVGARHLIAYSDSQLVVKQVEGVYEAKEENMIQYQQQIAELKTSFKSFQIIQIQREENVKVDCLSKLASALEDCRTIHVTIQYLPKPRTLLTIQAVSSTEDWRTPVIKWLKEGCLPDNRWEAARLKARAIHFLIQGGVLYKKILYTTPTSMLVSTRRSLYPQRST